MANALDQELKTYKEHQARLNAEHPNEFVLIHGDAIVEYFNTYEDAVKIGYERFGLKPFLVKKIQAVEHVQFLHRHFSVRL